MSERAQQRTMEAAPANQLPPAVVAPYPDQVHGSFPKTFCNHCNHHQCGDGFNAYKNACIMILTASALAVIFISRLFINSVSRVPQLTVCAVNCKPI